MVLCLKSRGKPARNLKLPSQDLYGKEREVWTTLEASVAKAEGTKKQDPPVLMGSSSCVHVYVCECGVCVCVSLCE